MKLLKLSLFLFTLSQPAYSSIFQEENIKNQMSTVASSYVAFCKERKQKFLEDVKRYRLDVNHPIKALKHREGIEGHKNNINTAKNLQKMVDDYCVGALSGNDFLYDLLEVRFNYLSSRKERRDRDYIPGTFPEDLKKLQNKKSDKGDYNYQLAIASIDRFQMLNKLIVLVFLDCGPNALYEETKDLIRASVSLHPVLLRESEDLGHPDLAIYKSIYNSKKKKIDGSDFGYYYSCIEEGVYKRMPSNWRYYDQLVTRNTYYKNEKNIMVRDINIDLPEAKWLEDTNLFHELTHSSDVNLIQADEAIEESIAHKNIPDLTETIAEEIFEIKTTEIFVKEDLVGPEIAVSIVEKEIIEPEITLQSEPEKLIGSQITDIFEQDKTIRNDIINLNYYTPPKGMRHFHSSVNYEAVFEGHNRYLSLNTNYKNIVDAIFARTFEGISFREFRTLFEHINGPESIQFSKSGGSHIKLLDQYGNFVGATFAHGNNHEYTKSTIPYLIDALVRSGVWPQ